ncbi:MAG: Glycosyl transferase group 1 [Microgenomates group bacterium GW2011_GWC1_43_11]|nr:MAG: Glycosyl transferase group 1 [Microgenomates group bacterium GW2011_GWC1_43_11]
MMNLRIIGINTLFMIPGGVGGTEQNLRAALTSLEKQDLEHSYVVFCNIENYATFQFTNPLWKKVLCPIRAAIRPLRIIFEQLILPLLVIKETCDVLHSFGYFGPLICPAKHIVTIHDCNWRDHPEDFGFFERYTMKMLIELNMRYCSSIMSVSEFTKRRLIHYFPHLKRKIHVIQSCVSEAFLKEAKKKHMHPLYQKRFVLCVSGMYPHKKIPYLLDLWKEISKINTELHLVLIGKNGKDEHHVKEAIIALSQVHYFPQVSLRTLVSFYQHAQACIIPSVYEGFGYPVYEAASIRKTIFVGKKQLYLKPIQKRMYELSFDVLLDVKCILSKLKQGRTKNKKSAEMPLYSESIRKLMMIYNNYYT